MRRQIRGLLCLAPLLLFLSCVPQEGIYPSVIPTPTPTPEPSPSPVEQDAGEAGEAEDFTPQWTFHEISEKVEASMRGYTYHEDTPVPLSDLRYLLLSYWGYDDKPHTGELVVHRLLAEEVCEIFRKLYEARFPIEKMVLPDVYGGDDNLSMGDNNTSGFADRYPDKAKEYRYSYHTYGLAIDINPLVNPWNISPGVILPPGADEYADRTKDYPGKIDEKTACYQVFSEYGWQWGGHFNNKDWQHFWKEIDIH